MVVLGGKGHQRAHVSTYAPRVPQRMHAHASKCAHAAKVSSSSISNMYM